MQSISLSFSKHNVNTLSQGTNNSADNNAVKMCMGLSVRLYY